MISCRSNAECAQTSRINVTRSVLTHAQGLNMLFNAELYSSGSTYLYRLAHTIVNRILEKQSKAFKS